MHIKQFLAYPLFLLFYIDMFNLIKAKIMQNGIKYSFLLYPKELRIGSWILGSNTGTSTLVNHLTTYPFTYP